MRLAEMPYLLRLPDRGSRSWLIRTEVMFRGVVRDVPRIKISPKDMRSAEQLAFGSMSGGDRMLHHGYAPIYAHYLRAFLAGKDIKLAEFGILKGTGLAIWCDLFEGARILGFDIDPSHFHGNRKALERRGAFTKGTPEVHEYDQLSAGEAILNRVLQGQTLDIVIDDGLHSMEAILNTWRSVKPHLSSRFVYFIEDYANLLDSCVDEFAGYDACAFGLMTVISAGVKVGRAHGCDD